MFSPKLAQKPKSHETTKQNTKKKKRKIRKQLEIKRKVKKTNKAIGQVLYQRADSTHSRCHASPHMSLDYESP